MNLPTEDEARLPSPARAAVELPTLQVAHARGIEIDDLDTARTVAVLLSRFLGRGRSQSRSAVRAMMNALAAASSNEVFHDGEVYPAPHPELVARTWPDASTGFRRLGVDADVLGAYWRSARNTSTDACYPIDWLLAFFPADLWPAVATLISWGPEHTRVRLESTALALAERKTTRQRRRRPKGSPLAHGTVDAWLTALMGLMSEFVELRTSLMTSRRPALPIDLVDAWVVVPPRPNLREAGIRRSGQDNSGPPLEVVQRTLRDLAIDYERNPEYPYHRLRRLLLLSLCAMYGIRATALRTARVADFVPDVIGPDGARRDVLVIRPGKTWDPDEVHRLPLPDQLGLWMRDWIALTGRLIGDDGPLFPGKKPKPGMKLEPLSSVAFYAAIAGTKNGTQGSRALIPLDGDPNLGYRQHGLRHTAQQLNQRAAVELKAENPGVFDHLTPEDFSRAVLGHSLARSTPDVYRDLDRSKLTHLVADKAWQILWGAGTARTGLDPEAIKKARERMEVLSRAVSLLEREHRQLVQRQSDLGVRVSGLAGDELARRLVESNARAAQIDGSSQELARLRALLVDAEHTFEEARHRLVPLPEDCDEEEYQRLVEEALGEATSDSVHVGGPLADFLAADDLAEIWDTTEQTINRWCRSGFPTGRPEPWDNVAWIVEGPRKKRLPVDAIRVSELTDGQRERLVDVRRRRASADGVTERAVA